MKLIDNISQTLKDDLKVELKKGSKVSIAAACFSIYAYRELKKQLSEFAGCNTDAVIIKDWGKS